MKRALGLAVTALLLAAPPLAGQISALRTPSTYVGNTHSHLLHLIYYHHLPEGYLRENFATREEAERKGYRLCPVCFPRHPMVPGYDYERQLGLETTALVHYYFPEAGDSATGARLRRLATRVLRGWPLPLRGYTYSFELVRSDAMKAFSCPTGSIFLTTGLLDLLESDEELEALLAHEIAHIEQRHAFRQFQAQRRAELSRDLLEIAREMSGYARELVLAGYRDDFEMEADLYAKAYSIRRYGEDQGKLVLLLNKLKDISWWEARTGGGIFSARSDIDRRIATLAATKIAFLNEGPPLVSPASAGRPAAFLDLAFQKLHEGTVELYTVITCREPIPIGSQGPGRLMVEAGATRYVLPQEEATFIQRPPEDEDALNAYILVFRLPGQSAPLPLTSRPLTRVEFQKLVSPGRYQTFLEFAR